MVTAYLHVIDLFKKIDCFQSTFPKYVGDLSMIRQRKFLIALGYYAINAITASAENTIPFTKTIEAGGWPMAVLGVLSLIATFMVIYFCFTLRINALMPQQFRISAEDIATNNDIESLHSVCKGNKSSGASIIGSVTKIMIENPNVDYTVLRDVIEDEGSRQASAIWQRIQYLMDIAVVAPMVGLLGTVLGMIQAFVGLKEDFGAVKPIALADGVSKALVTTAGGLIVGIIAMLFYSYFRGHVNLLIAQLEEKCNIILHRIIFDNEGSSWKTVKN